jgi:hypothetical protein
MAREFRLQGDDVYARDQTALAMREAVRLGLAHPNSTLRPAPSSPPQLARPAERPRVFYRGWLDAPGRDMAELRGVLHPLAHLSLRREPRHRRGPWTMAVLDRDECFVAWLPDTVAEIAARLRDEGVSLGIAPDDSDPQPRENGGLRLPFVLHLRGDEAPETARRRMEYMLKAAEVLPIEWDAERTFGGRRLAVLCGFVERAERGAWFDDAGRLSERQARVLLAWVERMVGPA